MMYDTNSIVFNRIVHGVDLTTLMTVVDDVALGDVSQEGASVI